MTGCCVVFFVFVILVAALVSTLIAKSRENAKHPPRAPLRPPPNDFNKQTLRSLGCSEEEIAKIEQIEKLKKSQNHDRNINLALTALESKKSPSPPPLPPLPTSQPAQTKVEVLPEPIDQPPPIPATMPPIPAETPPIPLQECAVCGQKIDPLAPPTIWQNYLVCNTCHKKLTW